MGADRLRRVVAIAGVNVLVFVVLLVPLELVFGTWVRPLRLTDLRRFSVPVDVRYEFDTSQLYARDGGGRVRYTRDRWGLRGAHQTLAAVDVLTVGGSTTEQRFLDDDATWQAVAERELARAAHPLVFANAGVDGQSTIGHLFNFEYWFPLLDGLKPRVILFYLGTNDVMRHDQRAAFDASADARTWRARSATFQLWRTLKSNLRARSVGVSHGRMPPLAVDDFTEAGRLSEVDRERVQARMTEAFLANVDRLRGRAAAFGAVPVFMTQTAFAWNGNWAAPARGVKGTIVIEGTTVNYADVSHFHRAINRSLMDFCRLHQVTCLDLAHDVTFERADYYDFLHNTPAGAAKIGRYVAAHLAELVSPAHGGRE